jgi:FAD/FMN-containing dehydrogenase
VLQPVWQSATLPSRCATTATISLVLAQWAEPAISERCIAWGRQTYADMAPFVAYARYVSYLDDDDVGDPVAAAYGPNYRRLQQLKTKYDPDNFFHMNQNIRPLS